MSRFPNGSRTKKAQWRFIFAKNAQKSAHNIRSTGAPGWRAMSYVNALLTLKVEDYLICPVAMHTNTNSVHDGMTIYLAIRNSKTQSIEMSVVWNKVLWNLKLFKIRSYLYKTSNWKKR
jgi:hypothetical protein